MTRSEICDRLARAFAENGPPNQTKLRHGAMSDSVSYAVGKVFHELQGPEKHACTQRGSIADLHKLTNKLANEVNVLREDVASLAHELTSELAAIRSEMREGVERLERAAQVELAAIRSEVREELNRLEMTVQNATAAAAAGPERPAIGEHGHDDSGPG